MAMETESFNTCSSCEEQPCQRGRFSESRKFQYMLLLRGATQPRQVFPAAPAVSIHAPLARSNKRFACFHRPKLPVSIHAPLARSNAGLRAQDFTRFTFQYMLLLRGATCQQMKYQHSQTFQYMLLLRGATTRGSPKMSEETFQYMLLLRGATRRAFFVHFAAHRFNTCSSCEEQQGRLYCLFALKAFQYMLLLRGAT